MRALGVLTALVAFGVSTAHGAGLENFIAKARPSTALVRGRQVVHVNNQTLPSYVNATKRGYLEVVVPAGKGHVYFRHGEEVFDFGTEGLRVGAVRPIKSDRYGYLIPLTKQEEANLTGYLGRLKATGGKELGRYDFEGEKGFHCVTWMKRFALSADGRDLVKHLGGRGRDWESMPRFARFLDKRAKGVESRVLYHDGDASERQLTKKPKLISGIALRWASIRGN